MEKEYEKLIAKVMKATGLSGYKIKKNYVKRINN